VLRNGPPELPTHASFVDPLLPVSMEGVLSFPPKPRYLDIEPHSPFERLQVELHKIGVGGSGRAPSPVNSRRIDRGGAWVRSKLSIARQKFVRTATFSDSSLF
jgi:hypothetical protein